jgi:uncharacterized membrane protein required for colicin V production
VDFSAALKGEPVADVVVLIGFGLFLFLGFAQGTIRRLLGIGVATVAFVIAANVRDQLGGFFADNWKQFDLGYNQLIACVIIFVAVLVIGNILIEVTYKRVVFSARHPVVDEVLGGLVGLVEGFMLLLFVVIIFNSYKLPDAQPGDISQLRDFQNAVVGQSQVAHWVRVAIAPAFIHLIGVLLPAKLVSLFP